MGSGYKWVIHLKVFAVHNIRTRWPLTLRRREYLTEKGEVAKKSSQQVHDKHGQDGDVGDALHTFLGGAGVKTNERRWCYWNFSVPRFVKQTVTFGLTLVAQCRWVAPLGGRQKRRPESGWCMPSEKTKHSKGWVSNTTNTEEGMNIVSCQTGTQLNACLIPNTAVDITRLKRCWHNMLCCRMSGSEPAVL